MPYKVISAIYSAAEDIMHQAMTWLAETRYLPNNMLSSMTGNTSYSAILLIAPSTSAQGAIAQSNVDMTENPGEEVQHAAYGDGARTACFIFSKQEGRAAYPRPSRLWLD